MSIDTETAMTLAAVRASRELQAITDSKSASRGTGPGGKKDDEGKLRMDLLPLAVLQGVAAVLTFGAQKYAAHSWQLVPDGFARYYAGLGRHFNARVLKDEEIDPDSGLAHAWHFACNALFVAWFMRYRPEEVRAYREAQIPEEKK